MMFVADPPYSLFSASEYSDRVERARTAMEAAGIDGLLLTSKENVAYFGGIRTIGWTSKHRPLGVLVPAAGDQPVVMVLPETLMDVAEASAWVNELRPWGGWQRPDAPRDPIVGIAAAAEELGIGAGSTLGLELGYGQRVGMSQSDFSGLHERLAGVNLTDAGPLLWRLRMIKSSAEIEALRAACDATSRAFQRGFEALRPGMTERELAAIVLSEMAFASGEIPGFVMVRSGREKYGMINCEAFEKPMEPGELVVVDLGATYHYYWSDFMRMASIGEPSAEQRRFFDANLAAQQAGMDAIAPGVTCGEVFARTHEVLVDAGLGEHVGRMERIGHGVGLDPHEPPSIEKGSTALIEENMVLTVEPIFFDKPNHEIGNFAIEDMVVVTATGAERISLFPRELYVVE
jgi:Xaa-Pro aminopeptidase